MGLDQFVFTCKPEVIGEAQVDFVVPKGESTELAYFRKHPDLQGWMEKLYYEKGGKGDGGDGMLGSVFNVVPVRLDLQDLERLEIAVKRNKLPKTSGFFFGESLPEDREPTLKMIEDARVALLEGMAVYYTSWW